jgi:plastocyanin
VTITETEFKLSPATITVPLNTPVSFTVKNAGTIPHNFQVELPSQNFDKKLFDTDLNPGETKTASFTFTTAGPWQMYCPVDNHEGMGMSGTVMVMAAQAAPASGASPSTLPVTGGDIPFAVPLAAGLSLLVVGLGLSLRRHAA